MGPYYLANIQHSQGWEKRERRYSLATQIDLLATLQELDQGLQQKEQLLQELREQVTAIVLEMESIEQEAQAQQQRVEDLETQHRDVEGNLKLEEEKIKEKRVRLNRIRNERELLATQREVELMREEKGKLEDNALVLMEQIEQEKEELVEKLARVEDLKTHHQQENAGVEQQIATLDAQAGQERGEREQLIGGLDGSLRSRYERIFAKCGGVAVVAIREETCQGCHMRIPPQMCNQIQSSQLQNEQKIFYCPHCARIVYWPKEVPEESEA